MDKYTYEDVIIDPNDPRVEIGAKYWVGKTPTEVLLNARAEAVTIILSYVDETLFAPFVASALDGEGFPCLIRKKELTYVEKQAEWVKENNLKIGDKVRVLRAFSDHENGFSYRFYNDPKNQQIGKICKIKMISMVDIAVYNEDESDYWFWPYFCLEKVEEPEFKVGDLVRTNTGYLGVITEINHNGKGAHIVRNNNLVKVEYNEKEIEHIKAHIEPFDLSLEENREKLRGTWVKGKLNDSTYDFMIIGFRFNSAGWAVDLGRWFTGDELFEKFTFLDGTPCGLVVEDEE